MNHLHALIIAWTIYHEAQSEGVYGMTLVASTIHNRAVMRDEPLVNVCLDRKQYSCWNFVKRPAVWVESRVTPKTPEWEQAWRIATDMVIGRFSPVTRADHYHEVKCKPHWKAKMQECTRHRKHVFYRSRV